MQTKRILDKAMANLEDRAALRRTADYIVRDLRSRSIDTMALCRREVSRSTSGASSNEFAAGYLTALGDVLAAFEAQLSQDLERAADARVAERPGFAQVLRALGDGHAYPKQIAAATDLRDYEVSRILKDLRGLDLAEQRVEETDRRRRPHHLTARGDAVVASLATTGFGAEDEPVAPVVDTIDLCAALGAGSSPDELSEQYNDAVVDAAAARLAELTPRQNVFRQLAEIKSAWDNLEARVADMQPAITVPAARAAAPRSGAIVASAAAAPPEDDSVS